MPLIEAVVGCGASAATKHTIFRHKCEIASSVLEPKGVCSTASQRHRSGACSRRQFLPERKARSAVEILAEEKQLGRVYKPTNVFARSGCRMRSIRCDEAYHFSAQVGDCFVGAGDKERLQHLLATTQEQGLLATTVSSRKKSAQRGGNTRNDKFRRVCIQTLEVN